MAAGDQEEARVEALVRPFAQRPGALLPVLHLVQEVFGFVPPSSVPVIARVLNLSLADVHGVVSFYRDFRTAPPARRNLRLCAAEACQAAGGRELSAEVCRRAGVTLGGMTADEGLSITAVYCLGLCSVAPAVMLDGDVFGRMDANRVMALLEPRE